VADILYISCHSVLEYDELRLLTSLGHRIFSCGSYFNPESPGEGIRPPLRLHQDPEWKDIFHKTGCGGTPVKLSKDFLSRFDYIIGMHSHDVLINNLKSVPKRCTMIWRGIGQSNSVIESKLKRLKQSGVKLIRYSPMESRTAGFAGEDALIRFYKKESDFKSAEERNGASFLCYNSITQRATHNDWDMSKDFVSANGMRIFGGGNEHLPNCGGFLSPEEQLNLYRTYSKVFCLSSYPAPYTLGFLEAVMSDIEIFINKNGAEWDERFLFGQSYERVTGNIYKFRADQKIRQLFSERAAKLAWSKLLD
jgi:hypothetical protein